MKRKREQQEEKDKKENAKKSKDLTQNPQERRVEVTISSALDETYLGMGTAERIPFSFSLFDDDIESAKPKIPSTPLEPVATAKKERPKDFEEDEFENAVDDDDSDDDIGIETISSSLRYEDE